MFVDPAAGTDAIARTSLAGTVIPSTLRGVSGLAIGSLGVAVAGLSTATVGSVGPLFASAVGLSISKIALFLVVSIIGGIISQIPSGMMALSASLIFIYAAGAIISPLIAGLLIEKIAAWAMFTFISAAHFLLMLYTIYRNFIGRTSLSTRAYAYVPRTSLFIATIIRGR